jgi:hypothetical protein
VLDPVPSHEPVGERVVTPHLADEPDHEHRSDEHERSKRQGSQDIPDDCDHDSSPA